MRKINWLVGSVALGLGMVIGIVGYAMATTPATGNSFLTKFGVGKGTQAVSNMAKPADSTVAAIPGNATDSAQLNPSTDLNANSLERDSTVIDEGLSQKISNDYKQNIGYFFDAWQSADMVKFRDTLAKAYVGDLYEKHARKAEGYIIQGIGLAVSDIRFDKINLESATATAATLEAIYHYTAQDYNLGEQTPQGEKTEHLVHVRVNLILANGHWMISGETPLT